MKLFWCIIVAITLLKEYAEGSCLSYGHSCWGAHGKRSDPSITANKGHNRLMSLHGTPTYYANGSPSNRWALVKITPDKRNRNVIYAAEDSVPEELGGGPPPAEFVRRNGVEGNFVGDEQQTNPRDERVKLRMFRRFNVAARAVPAATAEASTVNDGPDDGNKVIRRKLIAEEQMLINDPEDTSELMSEEEAAAPSYINVLKQI